MCQHNLSILNTICHSKLLIIVVVINHAHYPIAAEVGDSWQLLNVDVSS